jgi:uncharacterized phage infection (PIP) family protein YhgE
MAILFETELDDSKFQDGLKNMEKGGKRVEGSLVGSFDSMAKGIGASMAASFTVGAVVGAAKSLLDFAGQLQDQADALGVSTEKLQGLQGALSQSGVSAEKFTKGMATLAQNIEQAKNDTGTARDSFEALGITFEDIANDSPDELILKIADGLKNAKDPAAAFAAALDLLGKNNINFVAGLKGGREEVDNLANSIKKLSTEDVATIAKAGDEFEQLGNRIKVEGSEILTYLLKQKNAIEAVGIAFKNTTGLGLAYLALRKLIDGDKEKKAKEQADKPEYFGPENPTKYDAEGIEIFPKTSVDPRIAKQIEENAKALIKSETDVRDIQQKTDETNRERDGQAAEKRIKQAEEEAKKIKDLKEKQDADDEKKRKQAAKDAIRDNIEKAGQDLQQAKQRSANAAQNTDDARSSLQRALEGNPDARETGMQKQVKRQMDRLEKQLDEPAKDPNKGTSLDDAAKSTSSRRGTKKALEELKAAKDAEKAAKKAEDLIKEQQKKMVKALEDIDKGINGN